MKPKLAIIYVAGCDKFLQWAEAFKDDYEIQFFNLKTQQDIAWPITWADVVWFEFAAEAAIWGTHDMNIQYKKVIVRLHSYECLNGYIPHIEWSVVDHLMFVAHHVKDLTMRSLSNEKKAG